MTTAVPTYTPLPSPAPQRNDPANFSVRGDLLLTALPNFGTELNNLAANVYANALEAYYSAASALGIANYKGAWSSLSGALNIPASVSHNGNLYYLVSNTANVASITPGASAQWIQFYTPVTSGGVTYINPALQVSGSTSGSALTLNAPGNTARGAEIAMLGNTGATPNKFVRVFNGILEIVSSSYATSLLTLTDAGTLNVLGTIASGAGMIASGTPAVPSIGMTIGGTSIGTQAMLIDPSRGTDAKRAYVAFSGGNFSIGYHNDAVTMASAALVISGSYAAGPAITLFGPVTAASGMTANLTGAASLNVLKTGDTMTGALNVAGAAGSSSLVLTGSSNTAVGAQVTFLGNGASTQNKYLRVTGGQMEWVNSAYSAVIASLTDAGVLSAAGFIGPLTGSVTSNSLVATAGLLTLGLGSSVQRTIIGGDATNTFFVNSYDASGAYLSTDLTFNRGTGKASFSNPFTAPGTSAFWGAPQIRLKSANSAAGVGALLHGDGTTFYLLATANNDADGSANSLRPLTIDLIGGLVAMGHGLSVTAGTLTAGAGLVVTTGGATINSSGSTSGISLTDTGSSGAGIKLQGNGATTPSKHIRAINGSLEIVNSAYSAVVVTVSDTGQITTGGQITSGGGLLVSGTPASPSITAGGANLSGTTTGSQMLLCDPSRSAGNKRSYLSFSGGNITLGYHDDAISAASPVLQITGGYATGATLIDHYGVGRFSTGLQTYNSPSARWNISMAPDASSGNKVTIADGGTYDLAAGSGLIHIFDDSGSTGMAAIYAAFGVTFSHFQDNAGYGLSVGTAGKTNVYYNSGIGKYRIQNNTGGSKTYYISTIQLRPTS